MNVIIPARTHRSLQIGLKPRHTVFGKDPRCSHPSLKECRGLYMTHAHDNYLMECLKRHSVVKVLFKRNTLLITQSLIAGTNSIPRRSITASIQLRHRKGITSWQIIFCWQVIFLCRLHSTGSETRLFI